MNFELNDIQELVRKTFRDFVEQEVTPKAKSIDENKAFPMELFKKVGDLGFFGMRYPRSVGGSGSDVLSYCLAVIELAKGSLSLAVSCTMQSLMSTFFLYKYGDKEVRYVFRQALKGIKIGAICMTEPNSGSDLNSIRTKATVMSDHFLLSGQKTWVTSAPVADFFTVFAKTDNHEKLSIFFVPSDLKGVQIGKNIEKLGIRGSVTSEVVFDEVILPKNYLLGEIGGGTENLKEVLAEIRIMTAALAIGVATAAFEAAVEYSKTREQFGRPIGKFQAVKLKIADMAVQLETARLYVFYAASLSDKDSSRQKESMIAKLYASECANSICDIASRIFASYGYAMDYPIQRYLRDARFTLIGGGTSEILGLNIGKELCK